MTGAGEGVVGSGLVGALGRDGKGFSVGLGNVRFDVLELGEDVFSLFCGLSVFFVSDVFLSSVCGLVCVLLSAVTEPEDLGVPFSPPEVLKSPAGYLPVSVT